MHMYNNNNDQPPPPPRQLEPITPPEASQGKAVLYHYHFNGPPPTLPTEEHTEHGGQETMEPEIPKDFE